MCVAGGGVVWQVHSVDQLVAKIEKIENEYATTKRLPNFECLPQV